ARRRRRAGRGRPHAPGHPAAAPVGDPHDLAYVAQHRHVHILTHRARTKGVTRTRRPIGVWGKMMRVTGTTLPGVATPTAKLDQACAGAVDDARAAIMDEHVGDHLGVAAEGERVVTHLFDCTLPGYRGWRWAVTVTRISRSKHVTVCETVLLPGDEALLAPAWVPWQERLQPGDLGVGDLLPTRADTSGWLRATCSPTTP